MTMTRSKQDRAASLGRRTLALLALTGVSLASPAIAASEPSTRLVSCESGSCLLVSGRRDNPASAVTINGHAVKVHGERSWRVRLPIETVRAWSEPYARSIDVATFNPETQGGTAAQADLPIGLLGHVTDLAFLVVSVK